MISPHPTARPGETRPDPRGARLLAGGLLVLALGLRLLALHEESLWYDEVVCVQAIDEPNLAAFLAQVREYDPPMAPGYFTLLYGWSRLVGRSVVALRLLSVALSLTSLVLLYCFAERLYGATAALVALAIAALSNTHIFFAQEIRVYALVLALATASMFAFHRLTQGGGARWWLLNVLANAALLATHFLAAWLLLAQGLFLLFFRARKPRIWIGWAACHAPFVGGIAWWMTTIDFESLSGAAQWIRMPGALDLIRSLAWATSYLPRHLYPPLYAVPALVLFPGVVGWLAWRHVMRGDDAEAKRRHLERFVQLALVIVVPPLALMAVSFAGQPVLVMRYHLYSSYALYILVGGVVANVVRGRRALATIIILAMAWHTLSEQRPYRPDWRNAAKLILDRKQPGDLILKHPPWFQLVFEYYDRESKLDIEPIPKRHKLADRVAAEVARGRAVWVICCSLGRDPSPEKFDEELRARHLEFRKFPFAGGQPTFAGMGLGRATLRQWFPTDVYHVVPTSQSQMPTPVVLGVPG